MVLRTYIRSTVLTGPVQMTRPRPQEVAAPWRLFAMSEAYHKRSQYASVCAPSPNRPGPSPVDSKRSVTLVTSPLAYIIPCRPVKLVVFVRSLLSFSVTLYHADRPVFFRSIGQSSRPVYSAPGSQSCHSCQVCSGFPLVAEKVRRGRPVFVVKPYVVRRGRRVRMTKPTLDQ